MITPTIITCVTSVWSPWYAVLLMQLLRSWQTMIKRTAWQLRKPELMAIENSWDKLKSHKSKREDMASILPKNCWTFWMIRLHSQQILIDILPYWTEFSAVLHCVTNMLNQGLLTMGLGTRKYYKYPHYYWVQNQIFHSILLAIIIHIKIYVIELAKQYILTCWVRRTIDIFVQ